jgi:hypothetical protein
MDRLPSACLAPGAGDDCFPCNHISVTTTSVNIGFEWDAEKARGNLRKHGVSFETAKRAFADPLALVEHDRIEGGERRWRTLGRPRGLGGRGPGHRNDPHHLGATRHTHGEKTL